MTFKNAAAACLVLACAASLPAGAQEAARQADPVAEEAPQTVTVRGVRDPAMAPYADAYDMLTKVRTASAGKVDLVIRVLSAKAPQPIPDLELTLTGATISEKLALSPDGFVDIPLDRRYLDDKAEILTNKPKGAVRAEFYFVPVLPKDQLTFGDLSASIEAARRAAGKVIPWYVRLFVGSIDEIALCYPEPGQALGLSEGASTTRPAAKTLENPLTKRQVACATFGMRELAAAKHTVVTAPPGWVALFN